MAIDMLCNMDSVSSGLDCFRAGKTRQTWQAMVLHPNFEARVSRIGHDGMRPGPRELKLVRRPVTVAPSGRDFFAYRRRGQFTQWRYSASHQHFRLCSRSVHLGSSMTDDPCAGVHPASDAAYPDVRMIPNGAEV